jgi:hypothetical protein
MNKEIPEIENYNQLKMWIRSCILSFIFHILFLLVFVFFGLTSEKQKINSQFFSIETSSFVKQDEIVDENPSDPIEEYGEHLPEKENEKQLPEKEEVFKSAPVFVNLNNIYADTTELDQLYKESTLNISIKYPSGWTFLDQNKKNKLDGVTFWAVDGINNPPPYMHLEVMDKSYFIEKRYLHTAEIENSKVFFNDPEEMEGYVSQTFYFRTETDNDFQIKLMLKGMSEFKSFQPRFWAIIKSFKYDNALF